MESSVSRYRELFDSAPVCYFNLNADGLILDVNRAGAKLFGVDQQQLKGRKLNQFFNDDQRASFDEFLADVVITGAEHSIDLNATLQSGKQASFRLKATRSIKGDECRLILDDVTDRNQEDEKLRLAGRALRSLPYGVVITGTGPKFEWYNKAFQSLTGYSTVAVPDQTCSFMKGEQTDENSLAALLNSFVTRVEFRDEILTYRTDGTHFWNEISVSPIRDVDGKITHFIGLMRDVTTQKQTVDAKRRIDERLNYLRDERSNDREDFRPVFHDQIHGKGIGIGCRAGDRSQSPGNYHCEIHSGLWYNI
jgi:PAS domain S-box-containing protein